MASWRSYQPSALRSVGAALLPLAIGASCARAARPTAVSSSVLPTAVTPSATELASAADWRLDPASDWAPAFELKVSAGVLEVGSGGERWLKTASGRVPARTLVPGSLVGVLPRAGAYDFVTAEGAVYSAREPLGTVHKTQPSLSRPRALAVGVEAILAVNEDGALLRSTDGGASYAALNLPQPANGSVPGSVREVAMAGALGAAIGFPQRLLVTRDDGASWRVVPSPDSSGLDYVAGTSGHVRVFTAAHTYTLDETGGALSLTDPPAGANAPHEASGNASPRRFIRVLDGRIMAEISGKPHAPKREWTLAVGDLSAMPTARSVPELNGCDAVAVAMRGTQIALACDARGTPESGVDETAASLDDDWAAAPSHFPRRGKYRPEIEADPKPAFITKIWTSLDAGRSFVDTATFAAAGAWQEDDDGIALGPGGWVFVTDRCSRLRKRKPYCTPAHGRGGAGSAFVEIATDSTASFVRFSTPPGATEVHALGIATGSASLYRFEAGSLTPLHVVELQRPSVPDFDRRRFSLDVDLAGTARGFVFGPEYLNDGHPFSVTPGGEPTVTRLALPDHRQPLSVAFAGTRALAMTANESPTATATRQLFESTDGATTWRAVHPPMRLTALGQCGAFGCVTDRGVRVGWNAASPADADEPHTRPKAVYAKPFACTASGQWSKIGGGSLPSADHVDIGSARWVLPTRDLAGRVTLAVNQRSDAVTKTSKVVMTGPAPAAPKYGAQTSMHVQPAGVVVRRYAYLRERKSSSGGRFNPVDAEFAWWRPGSVKIGRAAVPKLASFRVWRDPQEVPTNHSVYPFDGGLLNLDGTGLYFAPPTDSSDAALYRFGDDGTNVKRDLGALDSTSQLLVTALDGEIALASAKPSELTIRSLRSGAEVNWSVARRAPVDIDGAPGSGLDQTLLGIAGRPIHAVTMSFFTRPRAWGIFLNQGEEPSEWLPLPTQHGLGDKPRACDAARLADPAAYRFIAPFSLGTRHPVIVDADGTSVVLATGRATVRGSATDVEGSACVSALEAGDLDSSDEPGLRYSALVFPDALEQSLVFRFDATTAWPQVISMRPMACAYSDAPLPASMATADGFTRNASKTNEALNPHDD